MLNERTTTDALTPLAPTLPALPAEGRDPEKGAIGWAFLVWLFGGGIGLAIVVFLLLKIL